jgi:putative transposase
MVGIDLGVGSLLATSDGRLVENARFARRRQGALAIAQRELATKTKGSRRREKARERVAAHHRKVRNQRRDFARQVSRQLVADYDLIVFEDLKIQCVPLGSGGSR